MNTSFANKHETYTPSVVLQQVCKKATEYHQLLDVVEERVRLYATSILTARKIHTAGSSTAMGASIGGRDSVFANTSASTTTTPAATKKKIVLDDLFADEDKTNPLPESIITKSLPSTPAPTYSLISRGNNKQTSVVDGRKPLSSVHPVLASTSELDTLLELYHMILTLLATDSALRLTYHCASEDDRLPAISYRSPVPAYFANVQTQSMYARKVLSILGLRNLLHFGPEVFVELNDKLFCGDRLAYASDEGLNKMLRYTGNVVDLDTTVLRCNGSTLATINQMNERDGVPTYTSPDAFAKSQQAHDLVLLQAQGLIEQFCDDVGISNTDVERLKQRRVWLLRDGGGHRNKINIPIVRSNDERGRHAVWQYINQGVNSFHVNVPTLPDVIGSVLIAPYRFLRAFVLTCEAYGAVPAKRQQPESQYPTNIPSPVRGGCDVLLTTFFDRAVSDSCFDHKWKAVERYCAERLHYRGAKPGHIRMQTIFSETQQKYRDRFITLAYASEKEEATLLLELAAVEYGSAGTVYGIDGSGRFRVITLQDVLRWVNDPTSAM